MTKPAVLLAISSLLLSGCATMLSEGVDRVTISSGEVPESRIFVNDLLVGWDRVQVKLERGRTHTIRVERDGCLSQQVETGQELDPAMWGGVSMLGVAIATDVALGTAWKVDQNEYVLRPDCTALAMVRH